MKKLKLKVLFDCRERIYCDDVVIFHKQLSNLMAYFDKWKDVFDFITDKSLHDIDCEVLNVFPCEVEE